ncbi:hypothetical protein [Tenacibaculum phage JQ]|nr:hypothetical protein [Tenacibaculum phage JQ]
MDITKAMQICFKNNIKVFPVYFKNLKGFKICREYNNKPTYYNKLIKQNEINNAMKSVYIDLAKKL